MSYAFEFPFFPGSDAFTGNEIKQKILLATGNLGIRDHLHTLLAPLCTLESALNGDDALRAAQRYQPDLILADSALPTEAGPALLVALRKDARTCKVQVLALAEDSAGEMFGADDCLRSPFSPRELINRVKLHLELAKLRNERRRARDKLHSLFMQAPAPIAVLCGEKHAFEMANERYLRTCGRADILGRPATEIYPSQQDLPGILERVTRSGEIVVSREVPLRTSDEDTYWSFLYSPLHCPDDGEPRVIVMCHDVTDQVRSRQKLDETLRCRDEFISMASHELRTPVTALKLQMQLTQRGVNPAEGKAPTPERLARVLGLSLMQVERLSSLIEDMLDVSRIQKGMLNLRPQNVSLSNLVAEVLAGLTDQLDAALCPLEVKVPEGIEGTWDRARLVQVLLNLMSNAIKYAASSPIEVSASAHGGRVRITVRDHGPGIPPGKEELIFQRFQRAAGLRGISGLGLGLYISRSIIDAHGGKIFARNEPEGGASFVIELPQRSLMDAKPEEL